MKVRALKETLQPFSLVAGTPSLLPEYNRAILSGKVLAVDTARAKLWGIAPADFETSVELEVRDFAGIVSSLVDDQDFNVEVDENKLRWSCATAEGGIAFQPGRAIPSRPRLPKNMTQVDTRWGRMFDLGAAACSNVALQSVGLHGAAIRVDDGETWCLSSDNVSIAGCVIDGAELAGVDQTICVRPDEARLLAMLCNRNCGGKLAFDGKSFVYSDKELLAQVSITKPLAHDLWTIFEKYLPKPKVKITLPRKQIESFCARAAALSQVKNRVVVTVHVGKGRLSIFFSEETAYSTEYYLADNIPSDIEYEARLNGTKLAESLSCCDELIVDYMTKKHLVFRSEEKDFYYIISGSSEA